MTDILPYDGVLKLHIAARDGRVFQSSTYGKDNTGRKNYFFNCHGFRGEQYSSEAEFTVFVGGCSQAFGVGLNWEETMGYRFKEKVAVNEGVGLSDVNLLNFAAGGASNDYIVRTIVKQASVVKPNLILVTFTHCAKFEIYDRARAIHFTPSLVGQHGSPDFVEWRLRGQHFALAANDYSDYMRYLKNVLLLQWFCESRSIPLLCCNPHHPNFGEFDAPVCQRMLELIDRNCWIEMPRSYPVNSAVDGYHPGAISNALLADCFWNQFCSNIGEEHVSDSAASDQNSQ